MTEKYLEITETVLRDAHQSLMATRMTTNEMLPIIEKMDRVGYYSLECWGGATFDAAIRFLDEDPWERLHEIKKRAPQTRLQMLLRGQNLLGYRHYADDIVDKFIEKASENGIDVFRIFDALNDTRNLEASLKAVKKHGGQAELTICYTISAVHTIDYYAALADRLQKMGADSVCLKDMAGILTPYTAEKLVKRLKEVLTIPLSLHTHATSGISQMTYLKAVEAGVDRIDTAISPFSEGTSQPPTESMVLSLNEGNVKTRVDIVLLEEIADYFKPVRDHYLALGVLNPKMMGVDPKALLYQVPGGMLSNLYGQLEQAKATDKYDQVLKEVPKVREDLGYPPLVTPMSQMVGTQAVFNVLAGERYQMVPNEIKEYLRGSYGQSPVPVKEAFRKKIIKNEEAITDRPANHLSPEFDRLKAELGVLAKKDEDVLTYAMFPQVGRAFLEKKYSQTKDNPTVSKEDQKKNKVIKINAVM